MSVSPLVTTINANTTYQFTIVNGLNTVSNTSAVIEITFPSNFFSLNTGQTYTCFNTSTPSQTFPCRATTTSIMQINNPLVSSLVGLISVSTIKNPGSIESVTFSYVFKYSNGTIISQATSDIFRSYTAGSLQSYNISFNPSTVQSTTQITISIVLGNQVPKNGSIYVTFPSSWAYAANSSFPPIITSSSQVCTLRSSGTFLNSGLSCSTFGQQVVLDKCFNNTAPSGTSLSFSITNILSPPTIFNGYSIIVDTYTDTYTLIDQTSCTVNQVSSKSISPINSATQLTVGSTTQYLFDLTAQSPIAANDRLLISAVSPNDVYFSFSASSTVYILYNALVLTIDSSNSSSITLAFPSVMSTIPANTKISIIQGLFIKPLLSSGTRSLTLTLRRSGYDFASQSFSLTILPNSLSGTSISLNTYTISAVASYTFTMNLTNPLAAKSRIMITLPSQLSISNGVCIASLSVLSSPSSINSSFTCGVTVNRLITLGSINVNTLQGGQKLTIAISGILNSQTTKPTDPFSIYTYYADTTTDPTDKSLDQTVTMSPVLIGVVTVASSSPTVAQSALYTFSYTVKTKFLSNSIVRIGINMFNSGLPIDIFLGSTLSALFSITYTNLTTTSDQSCVLSNYTLNSVQFLQLSSISSVDLPAGTIITLKISSLINPSSLKPSASFSFYQVDSNGYVVQKLQTGITVTNTQTNAFSVMYAVQSTVRMNGQSAIYTVIIKSTIDLAISDYLQISMDNAATKNGQIYFSNTVTSCDVTYTQNGVQSKLNTTFERRSPQLLKINMNQIMFSNRTYQIAINTIDRARTAQTPNTITFSSFKYVTSSTSYGMSVGSLSPATTNKNNILQSVSLNIITSPSQLFSYQTFGITVVPKILLLSGDYIVIDIPRLYLFTGSLLTVTNTTNLVSIANQSLCVQSSYFCSHYSGDSYRIKVQQFGSLFSSTSTVTVTIKNNYYLSPSTFSYAGYYFKGATFASNNLGIDETVTSGTPSTDLTNAEFYITCNKNLSTYHCNTCLANFTCTACYQSSMYNGTNYTFDGYQFLTSDGKCVSICGNGYFISSINNICTKCDSPCNTCQTNSTTCLSCLQNTTTNKYLASNNTCLTNCPNSFYADAGNICQSCNSVCLTCQSDPTNCTSCPTTTFLNTNTNTCVSSTSCPFGTYADITTNKCSSCDASCNGCVSLAKNCSSCATGYIVDISNSTFKNCTNRCPLGTVNDTVNNLGCRCQTQCLTCQTTVSTCTSCNSASDYKYFYSSTCLISCPQSTYSSLSATGSLICADCGQSNCKICDSSICSQCIGTYYLYKGTCVQTCPLTTMQTIENGILKCTACAIGCLNCNLGSNLCSTCDSGYLKQSGSNGTYCTTNCSSGYVNFNNTNCYTVCPDGYENINQVCNLKKDNTTTAAVVSSQLSSTKRVPFPFIIASAIFLVIIILSKIVLPESLVSTLLTSVIGLLQPFSWIVAIVVCVIETSGGKHWDLASKGVFLLISALIINFILNIIAMIFFCKYIRKDSKFSQMVSYNEKKVFLGKCPTTTIIVLAIVSSHKVLQVLFSNFLLSKHFSYKLQTVTHMVPLNYVLFCSALPSVLAIAGGSLISYELQSYSTSSSAFIAALDMILVTLFGLIVSLWVTNRKSQDYEKQIGSNQFQKHYQTQQILVDGNGEDHSQNLNEIFMEKSGIRRQAAAKGKNYFYENSRISERAQSHQSHDNDPLTKRQNNVKPINQSNRQKIRSSNLSDEHSSQALIINEMQRRRNLKDQFNSQNSDEKEGDLEIIDFQNSKNKSDLLKGVPLITKIHYPNTNQKKEKPEELLKMTPQQKMLLKKKIESQLSPQQKVKLGILNREKQLKIKKKKQKIDQILKIDEKEIEKLSNQEQNKISNVKEAVDVLKRKEIKIEQYLLYSEIIKEEEGQYDEESQQQISQINQKAHTIIKGIEDDDQDLEEVIKLSPKRKRVEGRQNMSKSKSKDKISHIQEDRLARSKSKDRNSLSKDKKETSKQKTIRKDNTANKKDKKNQRRNKFKPPNDLQVNYNIDENGNGKHDVSDDESFDSEKQPELPKTRSNIVGKIKTKNRSEKQINMKKITSQPGDLMMIDVGSNRHNRTQNQISGELQLERADTLPPNHLRSTQKVEYKKKNLFNDIQSDKNVFDSENDKDTMKSYQNDVDFQNDILPTQFKVKNKNFDYVDQSLDMPVKPKILAQNPLNQHDTTIDKKAKNVLKYDGFDIYEGEEIEDQLNYPDQSKMDLNNTMSRYSSSNVLNYDSMLRKNMQNQKLKQLEKIYLPRLDSKANKKQKPKRQLSLSKINTSKF